MRSSVVPMVFVCVLLLHRVCESVAGKPVWRMAKNQKHHHGPTKETTARKKNLLPCEKITVSLNRLQVCEGSKVTFENVTLSLTPECLILPRGCVSVQGFEAAEIDWRSTTSMTRLTFGTMQSEGRIEDGCKAIEDHLPSQVIPVLEAMNISTKCPIGETRQCASNDTAIDLKKDKAVVSILQSRWASGIISGDLNIKDGAGRSCVKFELEVVNKRPKKIKSAKDADEITKTILDLKERTKTLFNFDKQ